jgi:aspartyl protease family protein
MSENPQKLGKSMITFAWILALVIFTLFFNMLSNRQHNPNANLKTDIGENGARTVTLQRNRSGHYIASGQINDVDVQFLLDTGATVVSIPDRTAKKLGLKRGMAIEVSTANGVITAYSTEISKITLGNIELSDIRASINPQMEDEEILLGMSFLKHLEFTQRGDTLILKQYAR